MGTVKLSQYRRRNRHKNASELKFQQYLHTATRATALTIVAWFAGTSSPPEQVDL